MPSLLQVALYDQNGAYITDPVDMAGALEGSLYLLDQKETAKNDGIAMIITQTEKEAERLMGPSGRNDGRHPLPSGCTMEVPVL